MFGRYAGFTALLPTMAGAADRCVIPEYPVDVEQLSELLRTTPQLVVVLVDCSDPGNAGTVIRTADAAGADC